MFFYVFEIQVTGLQGFSPKPKKIATQLRSPAHKPRSSALKPRSPAPKHLSPVIRPRSPAPKPRSPALKLGSPALKSRSPALKPWPSQNYEAQPRENFEKAPEPHEHQKAKSSTCFDRFSGDFLEASQTGFSGEPLTPRHQSKLR